MKKYSVQITNKARSQYYGIFNYVKNTLKAPMVAITLMQLIDKKIEMLDTMPNMYTKIKGLSKKLPVLRYITANNYNIIFSIDEKRHKVFVQAILYCKSNMEFVFNEPNKETLKAMKEIDDMEVHPEMHKGNIDINKMFDDILEDS